MVIGGNTIIQSSSTLATSTVSTVGLPPANGALYVNGPIFSSLTVNALGGLAVGTSTPQSNGNLYVSGNITAGGTVAASTNTGTTNASNVSAGQFGSNTSGGNYSFPAGVGINGTYSGPGILYVNGGVNVASGVVYLGPPAPNWAAFENTSGNPYQNITVGSLGISSSTLPSNPPINGLYVQGSVGIGTTAPANLLDVKGAGDFQTSLAVGTSTQSGTLNVVGSANISGPTPTLFFIGTEAGAQSTWIQENAGNIGLGFTGSAAKITIASSGNVGIGTAAPTSNSTLDLAGALKFSAAGAVPTGGFSIRGVPGGNLEFRGGSTGYSFINNNNTSQLVNILDNGNVGIAKTNPSTALDVNGTITGTTKNFDIPYPGDPSKRLIHSTLEGPEIAVFYRGQGQLDNGQATITLPSYFEALTRKEGRTVLLTPKFDDLSQPISNLAASAVENGKFMVRAIDTSNLSQKFYWEVKAVRADVPVLEVVKQAEAEK